MTMKTLFHKANINVFIKKLTLLRFIKIFILYISYKLYIIYKLETLCSKLEILLTVLRKTEKYFHRRILHFRNTSLLRWKISVIM